MAHYNVKLTRREQEILVLISNGLSRKEIATLKSIAVSTVRHHVKSLLNKLCAANSAELVRKAVVHEYLKVEIEYGLAS